MIYPRKKWPSCWESVFLPSIELSKGNCRRGFPYPSCFGYKHTFAFLRLRNWKNNNGTAHWPFLTARYAGAFVIIGATGRCGHRPLRCGRNFFRNVGEAISLPLYALLKCYKSTIVPARAAGLPPLRWDTVVQA